MSSSCLLQAINFSEQLLPTLLQGCLKFHVFSACQEFMLGLPIVQTKLHVSQQYFKFVKVFKLFVHLFVCTFFCSFLLSFIYLFIFFFIFFYFILFSTLSSSSMFVLQLCHFRGISIKAQQWTSHISASQSLVDRMEGSRNVCDQQMSQVSGKVYINHPDKILSIL